jgi:hypothetical protein
MPTAKLSGDTCQLVKAPKTKFAMIVNEFAERRRAGRVIRQAYGRYFGVIHAKFRASGIF